MWRCVLLGSLLAYGWYIYNTLEKTTETDGNEEFQPREKLIPPNVDIRLPPSWSPLHVYENGAICSDKKICSAIGKALLQQGGNAIDAVIGTLLCNGLVTMQSMGLGGGVFITYYSYEKRKSICIMGRERAPANINKQTLSKLENISKLAQSPLAIAVPGEMAAYYEAHHNYGILPWENVIQPTIDICKTGYTMTRHQYDALYLNKERIRNDKLLKKMFINPNTREFYPEGQHIQIPRVLCKTLNILKEEGALSFYKGTISKLLVEDLHDIGSIIQHEDLKSYKVEVKEALTINFGEMVLHLPPPPASGHVIAFIMNILKHFQKDFKKHSDITALGIHRLVEAIKFGFVKRWEYDALVDDKIIYEIISEKYAKQFAPLINDSKAFTDPSYYGANLELFPTNDYGTAHICVLGPNGDAISATSSINYYFGSGFMGSRTGILFNNAIADFTIDNMKNYFELPNVRDRNHIENGNQPMSSMAPLIITNRKTGQVRLTIGAAGGSRIISTLVEIIIRVLWLKQNVKEAIDAPRIHHQLLPNILQYEFGLLQQFVDILHNKGHRMERLKNKSTAVCGIEKINGKIRSNADYRKEGSVNGF